MSPFARSAPAANDDALAAYRIAVEPFYKPRGDEIGAFEAARALRMPMLLKGPTGCGKTRFVEHMAWRLGLPLVTVACHEDLGAGDLLGRWLLEGGDTKWQDGPLTLAARHGGLCYLDELIEARANTTVAIHPLTDSRRMLALTARNEVLHAHPDFQLVVSYNPSPMAQEMKTSTRQRFGALEFGHFPPEQEAEIVAHESGLGIEAASSIVAFGVRTRRLQGLGLEEGASTRMLVGAASLAAGGLSLDVACRVAIVDSLSDDPEVHEALRSALDASL